MNIYEADILSQGEDMSKALESYREHRYAESLMSLDPRRFGKIIFTGMGSSFFACNTAVTLLRNKGFHCYAVQTSQLVHYEAASIDTATLLVAVSQSGRSGEIVELIQKVRGRCFILGLTNDPQSPLGLGSDLTLNLCITPEKAVSTRTYLAPLMLLYIMAKVFAGNWTGGLFAGIEAVIKSLKENLDAFESLSENIEKYLGSPPYISFIGRGFSLSTVEAGALFIKEVAKYPALPFDSGQFRHGPFEMIGRDFSCFVFAPRDQGYEMQLRLASDIAARGSKVVLVSDGDEEEKDNMLVIKQQYPVPELADMINVVPIQAFGNYIAKRKGLEVGVFLYSSKITQVQ
jgi:glucosamine--fructose-6-phosphate aminotransferase (isomerizing)